MHKKIKQIKEKKKKLKQIEEKKNKLIQIRGKKENNQLTEEEKMELTEEEEMKLTEEEEKMILTEDEEEIYNKYLEKFKTLWNKHINTVAYETVKQKYEGCPLFQNELNKYKDKIIVEASPYDEIWVSNISIFTSDILCEYVNAIESLQYGENILGLSLMRVLKGETDNVRS